MPHKHIETSQTGFQGSVVHENHQNVKVHKLNDDRPIDKSHYLMTWFAEILVGEPIVGHYLDATVVYIIEGELNVEDKSKPGQIIKLVAGDVIHIDEDSYISWTSPDRGKVFAVSHTSTKAHVEDYVHPVEK